MLATVFRNAPGSRTVFFINARNHAMHDVGHTDTKDQAVEGDALVPGFTGRNAGKGVQTIRAGGTGAESFVGRTALGRE